MAKRNSPIISFFFVSLLGILVFVVFSHIKLLLTEAVDLIVRILLLATRFVGSMMLHKNDCLKPFGKILYAFFAASVALALDYYLPTIHWFLDTFDISIQTPPGIALDKPDSSVIIMTILILNRLSGETLGSLYLRKGKFKKGLLTAVSLS